MKIDSALFWDDDWAVEQATFFIGGEEPYRLREWWEDLPKKRYEMRVLDAYTHVEGDDLVMWLVACRFNKTVWHNKRSQWRHS